MLSLVLSICLYYFSLNCTNAILLLWKNFLSENYCMFLENIEFVRTALRCQFDRQFCLRKKFSPFWGHVGTALDNFKPDFGSPKLAVEGPRIYEKGLQVQNASWIAYSDVTALTRERKVWAWILDYFANNIPVIIFLYYFFLFLM